MKADASTAEVVVVDDNGLVCRTLARLLSRSGHPAHCIEDGASAVEFFKTCQPSVVLLDVMMPGMDGFAVLRAIRADHRCSKVVVIMYTALSDAETREQAMSLGANEYLVKGSLSFEQIQEIVDKHSRVPD